ncbi:MAG TPA: DUF5131 family protein [Actinobacteria bacterium]|nr:DUF5131 family protein [Actinomycetota bacterium]
MQKTGIEYLTHTWNPIAMRCDRVSAGCKNCWHLRMAKRHAGNKTLHPELREARGGGPFVLLDDELIAPLRTRKPGVIGVQFMGDLFHKAVTDEQIAAVFGAMAMCENHTFVILTKRPGRMAEWFEWAGRRPAEQRDMLRNGAPVLGYMYEFAIRASNGAANGFKDFFRPWPLPNIILGVSVEDQETADERIPLLLDTPAARRVVSYEPALGGVDFGRWFGIKWCHTGGLFGWRATIEAPNNHVSPIDGIICGPETGPGKRPMDLDWARSCRDQCTAAGVAFYYKGGELDGVRHEATP